MAPNAGNHRHTLALVLCALGKATEALEQTRLYLSVLEMVRERPSDATDLITELAAHGWARQALEVLKTSPSAEVLEPLVVGLRLFLREDVNVAAEVLAVGKDVKARIGRRRAEIEAAEGSQGQQAG